MNKEFGYVVCPIGFNIQFSMESEGFQFEKGIGSPEVSFIQPGAPVVLSTEFPSAQNEKLERRGGALLFKLKKLKEGPTNIKLSVKHENLQGLIESDVQQFELKDEQFFGDLGIRKAILLVVYSNLMKDYLTFCQSRKAGTNSTSGAEFKQKFAEFFEFLWSEKSLLKDDSLQQEMDLMMLCVELESILDGSWKEVDSGVKRLRELEQSAESKNMKTELTV